METISVDGLRLFGDLGSCTQQQLGTAAKQLFMFCSWIRGRQILSGLSTFTFGMTSQFMLVEAWQKFALSFVPDKQLANQRQRSSEAELDGLPLVFAFRTSFQREREIDR